MELQGPDWQADAVTGLPQHALAYRPDADVYLSMADADGPPSWLDELDLRPAPPTLHVGTHGGSMDEWLLADAARPMELALRSRLIDERRDVVFGALPGTDAASEELLAEVTSWLAARGIAHDPPDPDEHPLVAVGRLVQDDLCLMVQRDGAWHLDAGVLAFPSHWRLHDRIGLPMPLVHEHVAHYAEIGDRVDRFFDRLPIGRVVWRRNLSVQPHPHLYCPTAKSEMRPDVHPVQPDGSPYWLRSERQTLRVLPDTGAIAFAIRVQLTPASVLLDRPDRAADLAAMFRSWDEPQRNYKFAAADLFESFVGWLDTVAGRSGGRTPES